MAEPFLAEVKIVGFNFAPRGWAFCDGQILPINQNQSLYSLLGTTYGGDGRTSFALPDLRGRVPIHTGSSGGATHSEGQASGEETHTLTAAEMPTHTHSMRGSSVNATTNSGTNNVYASVTSNVYGQSTAKTALAPGTIANTGGGQGHENRQPYLVVNFCIALQGLFPNRN